MSKFLSVNALFAATGVICFAAAAVIESISADTVLPLLTVFGAVAVGTFYALKAPENARKKTQIEDAEQHIAWLSRDLRRTRNRLSRAQARLAHHGIDDDDEDEDDAADRREHPKPTEGKDNNDKNIAG